MRDERLLSALQAVPASQCSYDEWLQVGMALHGEGFDCSVWEHWSQSDSRYKAGDCERRWTGFGRSAESVTGGTIIHMARQNGWNPENARNVRIEWDDVIEYDGIPAIPVEWNPVQDLIKYLNAVFYPDEHICFCTQSMERDGKYSPASGGFSAYTAGQLAEMLQRYGDISSAIGDYNHNAGVWVRVNAMLGTDGSDRSVAAYRHVLVESDEMPIEEQVELYKSLNLPISALVHSGGKSAHALVRIDAYDKETYSKRVNFLFEYLEKAGLAIDRANRNPSRYSRLPGVERGQNRQYLIATKIGAASWAEWEDWQEGESLDLPSVENAYDVLLDPPPLPDELIQGVLRCGHKMLIASDSKAGKSFLLMELALSFVSGREWLGFPVKRCKVLYINLEIDRASFMQRIKNIRDAMELEDSYLRDLEVWNLRGMAMPLDKLVPKIIRRAKDQGFGAIIVDPIYKVMTGDENSASEMGYFCNQFDKLCRDTGCAAIYSHHHSKGAQGAKKAMDRASGSGVFARDPDAQLDLCELAIPDADRQIKFDDPNASAWLLECSLREFPLFQPKRILFSFPLHTVQENLLSNYYPVGSANATRFQPEKRDYESEVTVAFEEVCLGENKCDVKVLADIMKLSVKRVKEIINNEVEGYVVKGSTVSRLYCGG